MGLDSSLDSFADTYYNLVAHFGNNNNWDLDWRDCLHISDLDKYKILPKFYVIFLFKNF